MWFQIINKQSECYCASLSSSVPCSREARFRIVNLSKGKSLYHLGLQPVVWSEAALQTLGGRLSDCAFANYEISRSSIVALQHKQAAFETKFTMLLRPSSTPLDTPSVRCRPSPSCTSLPRPGRACGHGLDRPQGPSGDGAVPGPRRLEGGLQDCLGYCCASSPRGLPDLLLKIWPPRIDQIASASNLMLGGFSHWEVWWTSWIFCPAQSTSEGSICQNGCRPRGFHVLALVEGKQTILMGCETLTAMFLTLTLWRTAVYHMLLVYWCHYDVIR